MNLEILQREVTGLEDVQFVTDKMRAKMGDVAVNDMLEAVITHAYETAIKDCLEALPEYGGDPECEHGFLSPIDDCPNLSCEKRAVKYIRKDLKALLPNNK